MAHFYNSITCGDCGTHRFQRKGYSKNGSKMILLCANCGKRCSVDYDKEHDLPVSEVNETAPIVEKASSTPKTFSTENATVVIPVESDNVKVSAPVESDNAKTTTFSLFSEDGNEILFGGNRFTTADQIKRFCDKLGVDCTTIDAKNNIYKASAKRVHSKGNK